MKNNIFTWLKAITNIKQNFSVYLEINDHQLVMALAQSSNSSLLLSSLEKIDLSNSQVVHGIIFNHEELILHINSFIKKHRLKRPSTILNIPSLADKPSNMYPFITLQYALFISQSSALLTRLIAQPFPTTTHVYNFLDLLTNPKHSSPLIWLFTSTALIAIASYYSFSFTHLAAQKATRRLEEKNKALLLIARLEKESSKLQHYRNSTKQYKEQIDRIDTFKQEIIHPSPFLRSLAQSITPDALLTNVTVEKKSLLPSSKQHVKTQEKTVIIEGIAHKTQAVSSFIKNMHTTQLFKKLTLAQINKEVNKRTKIKNYYHFKIQGKLQLPS